MKKRLIFIILIIALLVTSLTACAALDDSISKPGTVVINVTRLAAAQNAELSFSSTNGEMTVEGDKITIAVSSRKTFQVTISSIGFKTETVTVNTADFKDDTATFAVEFGNYISSEFFLNIVNADVVPTVDTTEGVSATFADGAIHFLIDNIYTDITVTIHADGYEPMTKTTSQLQALKQIYFVQKDHFLVTLNTDHISNPVVLDEKYDFYLPKKTSSTFYFELPQSKMIYSFGNASSQLKDSFRYTSVYGTIYNVFYDKNNGSKYAEVSSSVYSQLSPYLKYSDNIYVLDKDGSIETGDCYLISYGTEKGTIHKLNYPATAESFILFNNDKSKYVKLTVDELIKFNSPVFQDVKFYTQPTLPISYTTVDYKVYYNGFNPSTNKYENIYVDCIVDGMIDHSLLPVNDKNYTIEYMFDESTYSVTLPTTIDFYNTSTTFLNGNFYNGFVLSPFISITVDVYDKNDNIINKGYQMHANLAEITSAIVSITGYTATTVYFTYDDLQHLEHDKYAFKDRKVYINSNYEFDIYIDNVPKDDNNYTPISNVIIDKKSYVTNTGPENLSFVCASPTATVSFRLRGKKYTITVNFADNNGDVYLDYNELIKPKS